MSPKARLTNLALSAFPCKLCVPAPQASQCHWCCTWEPRSDQGSPGAASLSGNKGEYPLPWTAGCTFADTTQYLFGLSQCKSPVLAAAQLSVGTSNSFVPAVFSLVSSSPHCSKGLLYLCVWGFLGSWKPDAAPVSPVLWPPNIPLSGAPPDAGLPRQLGAICIPAWGASASLSRC